LVPLNETLTEILRDAIQDRIRSATGHLLYRNGQPIQSIRGIFAAACRTAGLADFHFHDLRHTAVPNKRRARVDPLTAMKITGHQTIAVFQRYNSFEEGDLRLAARQQHDLITNLAQSPSAQSSALH
jgi:integrase